MLLVRKAALQSLQAIRCLRLGRTRMSIESSVDPKPPNIVIYSHDDATQYRQICATVAQVTDCLSRYALYELGSDEILGERNPWAENVSLLIVSGQTQQKAENLTRIYESFGRYVKNGGKAIGFGMAGLNLASQLGGISSLSSSSFTRKSMTCQSLRLAPSCSDGVEEFSSLVDDLKDDSFSFSGDVSVIAELIESSQPVIVRVCANTGIALISLARIDLEAGQALIGDSDVFIQLKQSNSARLNAFVKLFELVGIEAQRDQHRHPPKLSIGYLACQPQVQETLQGVFPGEVSVEFHAINRSGLQATDEKLPVVLCSTIPESLGFNWDAYVGALKSDWLGRALLYVPVILSTQTLIDRNLKLMARLPKGFAAVASVQTAGRGRRRNIWLSPEGCMMVSFYLRIEKDFGGKITFLQHLACIAAVEAIRSLDGYEDIDLRIKWPNDIYYGRVLKLGGVLVTSMASRGSYQCVIGCGFNVANSNPTICVNDIIEQYCRETGKKLDLLTVELVLARMFNAFERILEDYTIKGEASVLPLYYKYWIHGGQSVKYQVRENPVLINGEVIGVDKYGYLQIRDEKSGEVVTVGPDDNTFDAIKGLVSYKK